jgi:hypothetical protein
LSRLQNSIRSGRFVTYTQQKKQQIWKRLCRYARQLGIKIKPALVAACIAAGLCIGSTASAQITFTERTGAANPLNSVSVPFDAAPAFVDIDNDGDQDVFVGHQNGAINYYRNTGTAALPTFVQQTGVNNPLNLVSVGYVAIPKFVDIDNDGDKDAFVGDLYGAVHFFRNTGSATLPAFTSQTGVNNPLNLVNLLNYAKPEFLDIDVDGDMDAVVGENTGALHFFRNTGNITTPNFVLETGGSSPVNGISVANVAAPVFVNLDADADLDLFVGRNDGIIVYYRNTGTAVAPIYTLQAGAANPLNGIDVGFRSHPAFVDINNDGDMDAFIGSGNTGLISHFENTSLILPLRLLSFAGKQETGYNLLEWKTAEEINTKVFEVEKSIDGSNFTAIANVNMVGSGNNEYTFRDNDLNSNKIFYRLKMVDIDERFTYSPVIFMKGDQIGISVYPNPARNIININIGNNRSVINTVAGLYNVSGRLVQHISISYSQQQVNTGSLAPGLYTIKFADGSVQRFMKEY